MAEQFMMPKLGLTMEAGKIVQWLVADGTAVTVGQPVLLIETDKVESEVEATAAGLLCPIGAVGEEYPCGAPIGWFLAEGENPPATSPGSLSAVGGSSLASVPSATAPTAASGHRLTAPLSKQAGGRLFASPNAKRVASERGVDITLVVGTGPGGRITSEDVVVAPSPSPAAADAAAPTSPPGSMRSATVAGRALADLLGIDLAAVSPTGPDPRISRNDVAAYVRGLLVDLAPATPGAAPTGRVHAELPVLLQEPSSIRPLSGMRGLIADRMMSSLHTMAQLTLTMDVDMDGVVADRARRSETGTAPGYTDYVIEAVAAALVDHPVVNSQVIAEGLALLPDVHVAMAIALDDGLVAAVIRDTNRLDLDAVAVATSRLAVAARDGALQLSDIEGGTFSVTALGMFDVDGFTPIINAPNTAILGVGRLRDEVAISADGVPTKVARLTLSLTWDHRAFDGAPAAEFTRSVKRRLEQYR